MRTCVDRAGNGPAEQLFCLLGPLGGGFSFAQPRRREALDSARKFVVRGEAKRFAGFRQGGVGIVAFERGLCGPGVLGGLGPAPLGGRQPIRLVSQLAQRAGETR